MKQRILFLVILISLSCSPRKYPQQDNVADLVIHYLVLDSNLNRVKHDLKKDSANMSFEIQASLAGWNRLS
jgi:hypothetical protein